MNSTPRLTGLTLASPQQLRLEWNDDKVHELPVKRLRDECPCASCREQRGKPAEPELLPVLAIEETRPVSITSMQPVGNYAYSIIFSDGHDTGLFTLEFLRHLGERQDEA